MTISNRGGAREGAGRTPLDQTKKKNGHKIYLTNETYEDIFNYGCGMSFSEKTTEIISSEIIKRKEKRKAPIKFVDLFAGLGGIRLGFEQAFVQAGYTTRCVMTSEIKPHAINALNNNFNHEMLVGDITKIPNKDLPDFDILLAGFPCQAFSSAGKGHGFLDTRGTLFFEIERILKSKKPYAFILENVEGLILHDRESNKEKVGRTLKTILSSLEGLGYHVSYELLDSQNFGVPQSRKRIYIVGTLNKKIPLNGFVKNKKVFRESMQSGLATLNNEFSKLLFAKYTAQDLFGKSIKDKRGGDNNIHSWDIGIKGEISESQKKLLELLLRERRKKHWAKEIGIDWMDGMPLTKEQISTFYNPSNLAILLRDLVDKGYLVYENPKQRVNIEVGNGSFKTERIQDKSKPKGYNIVAGKLSFDFSKILNPDSIAPTLVAMDVSTIGVIDNEGIRRLSLREGLRLFGYPEEYSLEFFEETEKNRKLGFDLLGNTVTIPVIRSLAERLIVAYDES